MNPRSTGILFLVALALGAFVYFYQVRGEETRREAEAQAKRLFPDVEAADIETLAFATTDGQAVRLARGETGWSLAEPLVFPADETTASGLANTLAQLTSEGAIEEPQAPEIYGLGEDAVEVRFEAGGAEHRIRFGKKTPVGYDTYVAVDDSPEIYTVPSQRASAFQKPLLDLRERRVLRFDRAAVQAVDLAWEGGAVSLVKRGDTWHLRKPLDASADQQTVDDLLADLSFLRAEGFVDEPGPDAEAAFAEPVLTAVLHLADAEAETASREVRMVVGSTVPGLRRLVRGGESSLYEIANERLDDFPRRVGAYRYRTLADFPASDAQTLEMSFSGPAGVTRITAERGDDGWQSQPEAMAPGRIARAVTELSNLRADDVVADGMGERELEGLGLAPPQARFRMLGQAPEAGGKAPVLADVEFGGFDANRGIVARPHGSETIYRIGYELAEHLPVSLDAFRNRFLSNEPDEGEASGELDLEGLAPLELPDLESP